MAAVKVVLPWSMWPMVPTLRCGLVRVKTFLGIGPPQNLECPRRPGGWRRTTGTLLSPGLYLGILQDTSGHQSVRFLASTQNDAKRDADIFWIAVVRSNAL